MIKVFSLFSGVGGFELGLKNSNIEFKVIGFSEIDKYASQVLEKHFKGIKNYGDVKKIRTEELPKFDLLVGGFPCQSFSNAGRGKGFDDTRGTLFFEIARILKDKKPKHFILENVKGLLSNKNGSTFQTILRILSNLGYIVEWEVLNSKNFGVPQSRERVYFVGHLRGKSKPKVFSLTKGSKVSETSRKKKRQGNSEISSTITSNYKRGTYAGGEQYIIEKNSSQPNTKTDLYKVKEATIKGYAIARKGDSINLSVPNSKTRRGRVGKQIAQILDTATQQYTIDKTQIRRLTPIECERLQGFPDNWTEGLSDTQRYKCLGNAVTTNVIEWIAKQLYKEVQ